MHKEDILKILESVREGRITVERAISKLKDLPYEDLHFAKVDHHRHMRHGIPEVIFAKDKKKEDIKAIADSMYRKSKRFLITKASEDIYNYLGIKSARFYPASGIISVNGEEGREKGGILVISAGTSDIPVAEEAAVTASFLGSKVGTIYDVGVAGIHRVLDKRDRLSSARVIVVVAGMEGALPSVIGGLTDRPVIAVPASTGYGTSFGGITALFAMLNSCVPGIGVMNIDNGFGAGCLAHKINIMTAG